MFSVGIFNWNKTALINWEQLSRLEYGRLEEQPEFGWVVWGVYVSGLSAAPAREILVRGLASEDEAKQKLEEFGQVINRSINIQVVLPPPPQQLRLDPHAIFPEFSPGGRG
jgi:Fe2+ transport system protein FeoA